MNVNAYFSRIGLSFDTLPTPSLQLLSAIQRAHTVAVPFENVAMHSGEPLVTAEELYDWGLNETSTAAPATRLFEKIVTRRRGGFCFEQNVLLFQILDALGFRVSLAKAWVNGALRGQPIAYRAVATHVLVRVDGLAEGSFFVDCGLGPSPLMPLPIAWGEHAEFAHAGDAAPRRFWRLEQVEAADFGLPDAGPAIAVGFREASAEQFWVRICVVGVPWTRASVMAGLEFTFHGATSWFRNTLIAIRSTPTTLHVLQNETLVETDVRTGEAVKRHVPVADVQRVLKEEYQLDVPASVHLPLPL